MNPDTGAVYSSMKEALEAGESEEDIVEIFGDMRAVTRATKSIQSDARRRAKRRAARVARRKNR